MKLLKLLMTVLFLFLNFQIYGAPAAVGSAFTKVECWYTRGLQNRYYPRFSCNGNFEKAIRGPKHICEGSVQCKNHDDVTINFPRVICKPIRFEYCDLSAKECTFGPSGVYFNDSLRQMLPDDIRADLLNLSDEIRPVIVE